MSNETQPTSFVDLYTSLMRRVRVDTTQSLQISQAKAQINIGLFDMHIGHGEKFPWAERDARLLTQAPYSTGTVAITIGTTALVGAGTLWNTNNDFSVPNVRAGGKILFSGDETVYEVSSVGSDTTITLTDAYRGETLTVGGYTYWEDEYDLASDFLKPIDKTKFDGNGLIRILDRRDFRRRFTRTTATGKVVACAIFDKSFASDTVPVRRVRLWRPPSDAQYIPYSYVTRNLAVSATGAEQQQLLADTDEPIVPLYARHLVVLHALSQWYRDKKNDSRAQSAMAEYTDGIRRLLDDVEVGAQRPSLQPKVGSYRRNSRSPYRAGRGRRHTLGTAFDELRE